ncbi:type II secretion system F family protein [Candidatus Pacearchaeota archaeon]|nr:type II secretion system F family protein [Candidatus Pacearchaeota archaeon]
MEKGKILGVIFGLLIIASSVIWLRDSELMYLIIGLGAIIGSLPFVISTIASTTHEKEIERMFLEFSRNLVESVNSGTPISRSIVNIKGKDYGALTPHIDKLANQISLGIPIQQALKVFAEDTDSPVIKRAVSQISEAEKAGGNIEKILESVAESVSEVEKLKKEQKSAIYNLVVQGYIIFLVFIAIILVVQFKIIPLTSTIGSYGVETDITTFRNVGLSSEKFSNPFLFLIITQGIFTGLVIGKIAEGKVRAGIKHSFILSAISFLVLMGARSVFG